MFLGVYGGLGVSQAFFVLFASIALALGSKIASRQLHQRMLVNIMHSPMSFFETTPQGRIMNRFSKDISGIDDMVPRTLITFIRTFFGVTGAIFTISFATPIFLAVIVPLGALYIFIQVWLWFHTKMTYVALCKAMYDYIHSVVYDYEEVCKAM